MHYSKDEKIKIFLLRAIGAFFALFAFLSCLFPTVIPHASEPYRHADAEQDETTQSDASPRPAQSIENGNFTNLIVFIKFNGETEFVNDVCGNASGSNDAEKSATVKDIVENSYEKADYCVNDYYEKVSNGKVKIQNLYLTAANGDSLTLNNKREYYCSKQANNENGYDSDERWTRMYHLKADWSSTISDALQNGAKITDADGEKTYSFRDLDQNGDGYLDSLTIVYKYSDRFSVGWSDCLWNYQDFYDGVTFGEGKNAIKSGRYLQFTANFNFLYTDANGLKFASLKTMIHETGHIFGLKDLYRSETNSRVYYMSAMSNAISPVPQYISAKEREALGWLNRGNLVQIDSPGTYQIAVTSDCSTNDTICYKFHLASKAKTVYLEYRNFQSNANKYDTQNKNAYKPSGDKISPITLKSGLVCFLSDKDTIFPNNLYTYGSNWNYEVLGGSFATKSDSALAAGDSLSVSANLSLEVLSMTDETLTFRIVGSDFVKEEHSHSPTKVEYKPSTCKESGNVEYWYCSECTRYFSDEQLQKEIAKEDTVLPLSSHKKKTLEAVEPTCKDKGLTEGEICSVCEIILVEQREIDKLPHTPSGWIVDRDPTPDKSGEKHKECLRCFEILESETIVYQEKDDTDQEKPPNEGDQEKPPSEGDQEKPPSGEADDPTDETDGSFSETDGDSDTKNETNRRAIVAVTSSSTLSLSALVTVAVKTKKKRLKFPFIKKR